MVIFFYLLNIIIIILKLRIIYLYSLVRAGPGFGLKTGPQPPAHRPLRREIKNFLLSTFSGLHALAPFSVS